MLNKKTVLLTASLMTGLAAAFFRIVIFNRFFISAENRFGPDAAVWNNIVIIALFFLVVVFFLVSNLIKENGPAEFPSSAGAKYSSAAVAALLALSYPLAAIIFGGEAFTASNNSKIVLPLMGQIAVLLPLVAIIPTVIFFAAKFALGSDGSPGFKVLSATPAVWAALYVVRTYFDLSFSFRDTNRIICELAFLAVAFRFLSESRYYIKYPKPNLFLTSSCTAIMIGTAYALPEFIMTVVGVIPFTVISCLELPLAAIIVYFFIGSINWARAENASELPKGEKKPDEENSEDGTEDAEKTENAAETAEGDRPQENSGESETAAKPSEEPENNEKQ